MTSVKQIKIGRKTAIAVSYFLLAYPVLEIIFNTLYQDGLIYWLISLYVRILPIFLFFRFFAYAVKLRLLKTTLFLLLAYIVACLIFLDYSSLSLIVYGIDFDTIYSIFESNYQAFFCLTVIPFILQGFLGLWKEKQHPEDFGPQTTQDKSDESTTSRLAVVSLCLGFLGWLLFAGLVGPSAAKGAFLYILVYSSLLLWVVSVLTGIVGLFIVRKRYPNIKGTKIAIFGISISGIALALLILNQIVIHYMYHNH
jgi:hypothetical protein